jgi:hypothetical protein
MGTLHGQELAQAERYELHHAREKLKSVQKRIALFHTRMEGELPCVSSMAEIQALDNERETLRATIATHSLRKPDPDRQPTVEAPAITAAAAAAAEPAAAVVEYRAVTVTINEPEAEPANAPVPSTRPRRKKGRK